MCEICHIKWDVENLTKRLSLDRVPKCILCRKTVERRQVVTVPVPNDNLKNYSSAVKIARNALTGLVLGDKKYVRYFYNEQVGTTLHEVRRSLRQKENRDLRAEIMALQEQQLEQISAASSSDREEAHGDSTYVADVGIEKEIRKDMVEKEKLRAVEKAARLKEIESIENEKAGADKVKGCVCADAALICEKKLEVAAGKDELVMVKVSDEKKKEHGRKRRRRNTDEGLKEKVAEIAAKENITISKGKDEVAEEEPKDKVTGSEIVTDKKVGSEDE